MTPDPRRVPLATEAPDRWAAARGVSIRGLTPHVRQPRPGNPRVMSISTRHLPTASPGSCQPPSLEPGDRLARAEFERRFNAMPHLKKAELIEDVR